MVKGYPWDMEELAAAISNNSGVMRKPMSRQMFTVNDVRDIVRHPLGKHLAAMQVEQGKLKKGVRPETIGQLNKLASRHVVDEFSTYMATLPESEQKSLDSLRVPAIDSHTGEPFDTSIGQSVRDALGNKVCMHKTGDLISQAVIFLRKVR
jgi:hypothetical protein